MSAELYDAELAGAIARPAIDVLPAHASRKDKSAEVAPAAAVAAPVEPAAVEAVPLEGVLPEDVPAPELVAPVEPVAEPVVEEAAVRKVFGLPLSRGRRAKAEDPQEAPTSEVEQAQGDVVVPALEPEIVPVTDAVASSWDVEAPVSDVPVAVAPATSDHADEVRALQALLEASEQVRQDAEARTTAAEAAARTATNSVQEWQIRHREAEATISELAASLAGAESRMAELHQQVAALQAERDDLTSQLDAATSPTA
jgi:hypothetical protein